MPAPIRPLYMGTIQDAIVKGDVAEMKKVSAECAKHIAEYGDIATLHEALKVEIAKAEHAHKK